MKTSVKSRFVSKRRFSIAVTITAHLIIAAPALAQTFPGIGSKADWLKANGLYAEGNQLVERKKLAEAIEKYRAAIATYPSEYHYHYNLGLTLKKSGDLKGAAEALRKATQLNPHDWRAWKILGNCLYKSGELHDAKTAFSTALQCNPPASEVRELRAGVAACGN